ncbi:MAG: SGNH/GDSL hydrolase family protein [Lachnospiraceae bacterium]|nr:SGNH/GDSL hydrolase family protein [Lachnospiraceae bacterium]
MGKKLITFIYAMVLLTIVLLCFIIFFKLVKKGVASATSEKTSAVEQIVESVVSVDEEPVTSAENDAQSSVTSSADDSWFEDTSVETANGSEETVRTIPDDVDTTGHPILEGYEVLFIGDSLFTENDEEGLSIPCYFGYYTGAEVYNCSRPAMTASRGTNGWTSLPEAVDAVRGGFTFDTVGDEILDDAVRAYREKDHSDKKRIIIIDCCINDYTYSSPLEGDINWLENYRGGLKYTVDAIHESLPDAKIFFMTPYRYTNYAGGTDLNAFLYTQNDYVEAMKSFAAEYGIDIIDIQNRVALDDPNLHALKDDGLHPKRLGSRMVAESLSLAIKEKLNLE